MKLTKNHRLEQHEVHTIMIAEECHDVDHSPHQTSNNSKNRNIQVTCSIGHGCDGYIAAAPPRQPFLSHLLKQPQQQQQQQQSSSLWNKHTSSRKRPRAHPELRIDWENGKVELPQQHLLWWTWEEPKHDWTVPSDAAACMVLIIVVPSLRRQRSYRLPSFFIVIGNTICFAIPASFPRHSSHCPLSTRMGRRSSMTPLLFFRILLAMSSFCIVQADSKNYYNYNFKSNQNDNTNMDLGGMDPADKESATTSRFFTSTINPKAFLEVQPVCGWNTNNWNSSNNNSNSGAAVRGAAGETPIDFTKVGLQIVLTSVYLTCDSPGAYYQGSSTYRNSHVCTAGDKAQVNIALTIRETKENSAEQNYANELIYVSMESGFYNRYTTLFTKRLLCQMDITSEITGSGTLCPTPGKYYMQVNYDVPSYFAGTRSSSSSSSNQDENDNKNSDDKNNNEKNKNDNSSDNNDDDSTWTKKEDAAMHYTPDVRFVFTNGQGSVVGCASTGAAAWNKGHAARSVEGMIALTIAVSAFLLLFALLLWMNHQRRKRLERLIERKHKATTSRLYQYFKTLPNGQVVPIPSFNPNTQNVRHYHHTQPQQQLQLQQHYHQPLFHPRNIDSITHGAPLSSPSQPQYVPECTSGLESNEGVADGENHTENNKNAPLYYPHSQRPHHYIAGNHNGHHNSHHSNIPMISNPSYNETHLPTRPVI